MVVNKQADRIIGCFKRYYLPFVWEERMLLMKAVAGSKAGFF
jgi:hypothetical protein